MVYIWGSYPVPANRDFDRSLRDILPVTAASGILISNTAFLTINFQHC